MKDSVSNNSCSASTYPDKSNVLLTLDLGEYILENKNDDKKYHSFLYFHYKNVKIIP